MSTMHEVSRPVNLDALESAWAGWPDWADESTIELGPCPSDEDSEWWAAHAPHNDEYYDVEDEGLDEMAALEAAATDAMAWGLIPPDVAERIARTSLVGLADELTTSYADEAERVSGRRPSRDEADHALALAWFRHSANPQS